ncbi:hypothetical protein BW723_02995 [Polaribacter reichenbachii]|uniref:Glycosyl transferase family 1 domain-containing protein n=1 Tax=Polaribacter reichenbachii TaxID=996801 RepID=A0A1B8TVG7_9FLAO|nr:glycosyltransferase [Polaribacter reichenbachii]APZ45328.1 hypothetical protein BW723_02995 [Polaribacter reichenbachii]AUC19190.1 hypothetical protein BTO17_11000 [Polaribacter reichenbachii]OBY63653.1 hypothetical protein LPB301_12705 [Polaribacter reichenbachii]
MNLIIVPFHDWRKIKKEGFRTRDAHFIESLQQSNRIEKIIIINRPTTLLEIVLKKKKRKIEGRSIFNRNGFQLIEVNPTTYIVDYISKDIYGQIMRKFLWFIDEFSNDKYIDFINECIGKLQICTYNLLSQNVFAHKLISKLNPQKSVFDAWDNFCLIDDYFSIKKQIKQGYVSYSQNVDLWITNSRDNIDYFSKEFNLSEIILIKNGLDVNRFNLNANYRIPKDINNIQKPIVGFGGKITQTINIELLNYAILNNPEVSFVLIGQILDDEIFESIVKLNNVHYLGDKFYDEYPNYVNAFDICLVPYYIEENKKSGTNPIKVYEYLALNKKVIGTNGNGLEDLEGYLYLIHNKKELSNEIKRGIKNEKPKMDFNKNSWQTKTNEFLNLLQ